MDVFGWGLCWAHGVYARSLTKGLGTVNLYGFSRGVASVFELRRPRAVGTGQRYDELETGSGTSVSNQGGVSSDMPWKRLAVLLAGRPSNKAPR